MFFACFDAVVFGLNEVKTTQAERWKKLMRKKVNPQIESHCDALENCE